MRWEYTHLNDGRNLTKSEPSEIAKFENVKLSVNEEIVRFDVAVANASAVDEVQGSAELIHVKLRWS